MKLLIVIDVFNEKGDKVVMNECVDRRIIN